jgi:ribosomal protein S2
MLNLYDENENFYLIKAITQAGEKYVFNARTYVENIELAKHYSTLSSARRMAKAVQDEGYETKIISEKTQKLE